jgi:hypothetical protein
VPLGLFFFAAATRSASIASGGFIDADRCGTNELIAMTAEDAVRRVLSKIDAAWRRKEFHGLEQCFHEHAVIVGQGYREYASGRGKCAESYREFATNADVLAYAEEAHQLHVWEIDRGLYF